MSPSKRFAVVGYGDELGCRCYGCEKRRRSLLKPDKSSTEGGSTQTITPYQGHKRVFGHFLCPKCKRGWMSGNSWANMGQECKHCMINVLPHKQDPLNNDLKMGQENFKDATKKPHREELCQMCQALGSSCERLNVNPMMVKI